MSSTNTAAHSEQPASTQNENRRSSSVPSTIAPPMPPTWKSDVSRMAVATGMPASLMIVGSQLFRKYRFRRFMK